MVEKGVLDSVQEGGKTGAIVGFSVASIRSFLYGSEYAQKMIADRAASQAMHINAHRLPSGALSAASAMMANVRPTPIPLLLKTTGAYAGLGAVYLGTETFLQNARDKDDMWNRVFSGAFAGSLVGLRKLSWANSGGAAASITILTMIASLLGGTLGPYDKELFNKRIKKIYAEPETGQDG